MSEVEYSNEINRRQKEFPIGSVVYYVRNRYCSRGINKKVHYGLVEEHYPTCITLQLIEPKDFLTINGVPKKEYVKTLPTKPQKYPKGFTLEKGKDLFKYDELSETQKEEIKHRLLTTDEIKNPEIILTKYKSGDYVKIQENDHSIIKVHHGNRFSSGYAWCIEADYPTNDCDWVAGFPNCPYVSIDYRQVYKTYDEAQKIVDDYKKEFERQAALSDYDWVAEQIDHKLSMVRCISDEKRQEIRDWLLHQHKVEDIDVVVKRGVLCWKYISDKKWKYIEL